MTNPLSLCRSDLSQQSSTRYSRGDQGSDSSSDDEHQKWRHMMFNGSHYSDRTPQRELSCRRERTPSSQSGYYQRLDSRPGRRERPVEERPAAAFKSSYSSSHDGGNCNGNNKRRELLSGAPFVDRDAPDVHQLTSILDSYPTMDDLYVLTPDSMPSSQQPDLSSQQPDLSSLLPYVSPSSIDSGYGGIQSSAESPSSAGFPNSPWQPDVPGDMHNPDDLLDPTWPLRDSIERDEISAAITDQFLSSIDPHYTPFDSTFAPSSTTSSSTFASSSSVLCHNCGAMTDGAKGCLQCGSTLMNADDSING